MSEKLQRAKCELKVAVDLLYSLVTFLDNVRGRFDELTRVSQYTYSELALRREGLKCAAACTVYQNSEERRRNMAKRSGDNVRKVETFLVIVDRLIASLKARIEAYDEGRTKLQVLVEFKVLPPRDVRDLSCSLGEV
jgi:hypothetical protein